jgi:hypothetical protein
VYTKTGSRKETPKGYRIFPIIPPNGIDKELLFTNGIILNPCVIVAFCKNLLVLFIFFKIALLSSVC